MKKMFQDQKHPPKHSTSCRNILNESETIQKKWQSAFLRLIRCHLSQSKWFDVQKLLLKKIGTFPPWQDENHYLTISLLERFQSPLGFFRIACLFENTSLLDCHVWFRQRQLGAQSIIRIIERTILFRTLVGVQHRVSTEANIVAITELIVWQF